MRIEKLSKMKQIVAITIMLLINIRIMVASVVDYQIIPLPKNVELQNGSPFILDNSVAILYEGSDKLMKRNLMFLQQYIFDIAGIQVDTLTKKANDRPCIQLIIDAKIQAYEGYRIVVSEKEITIAGATPGGVFYGIQTLRKSLPLKRTTIEMPAVIINDVPRFAYRGMMLDCARHFFPLKFVKQYIEMMALHNMNFFHWHLTDDQGWRIEIKKYPRLTEFGSKRTGTVIGNNSDVDDEMPYGGFYTQEEMREIVEYARERYITVIPEIDMPGHMLAALACLPELGCTGGPYQVGHKWGVYNDVLCVGNQKTFEFVKNVLNEVITLFPSEYIHIGGDETPTLRWEHCPKCKALNVGSIQGYFTHQIEQYLAEKGRRVIGWDEMLEKGVQPTTTIMSWRGTAPGFKAAELGHDVVISPLTHCYFDYYQTKDTRYEPSVTGMWPIDVEKVYNLDPIPDSLSVTAKQHIIGVQANLWTEHVPTFRVAEYQLLPRMSALAEVQWTDQKRKNFNSFKQRITRFTAIYDHYGWQYALHLWPERMVKDRWKQ